MASTALTASLRIYVPSRLSRPVFPTWPDASKFRRRTEPKNRSRAQLPRHPIRRPAPIFVDAVMGDVMALLDEQKLGRSFRLGGEALRVFRRAEPVEPSGDDQKRAV